MSYERVQEILNSSAAKQKLVVLDACLSGPNTQDLKIAARAFSYNALIEYVKNTHGVALLASSQGTGPSSAKSPSPNLSLMTHFLARALAGDTEALDAEQHLTLSRLYDYVSSRVQRQAKSHAREQLPVLDVRATGEILIGDFSVSIVDPDSFDLSAFPVAKIEFVVRTQIRTDKILTAIRRLDYSAEYLTGKVNDVLPEYLSEDLGQLVPKVRKALDLNPGTVGIDGAGINFPSGKYTVQYEHDERLRGELVHRVSLRKNWFQQAELIPKLLDAFAVVPEEIELKLTNSMDPHKTTAGLEAKGWEITSEGADAIEAENDLKTTIVVGPDSIILRGLAPSEIFGKASTGEKALLLAGTLTRMLTS